MNSMEPMVRADMAEQPEVLDRLIHRRGELRAALAPLGGRRVEGVLLVARGSSDNAATYGRYVLEAALGRPAALSANSLFTRYGLRTRLDGWLVVAISQSGATPEVTEVVTTARSLGAITLALTNDPGSPLATVAHLLVALGAGDERAVPATKTYTATLVALALLAELLGDPPWPTGSLEQLPRLVEEVLDSNRDVAPAVVLLVDGAPSVHLGAGFLYCAALESALKMRETARLPVTGYAIMDFLHGPIAASGGDTVALCHVGSGPTSHDAGAAIEALAARGARVVTLGCGSPGAPASAHVPAPQLEESLAAVVHAVRGQQLAVEVAMARGLDPDTPEGLTKVTPTV